MFSMHHRPRLPVSTTLVVLLAVILAHGFALSPMPSSAAARQGLNESQTRLGINTATTANNTRLIGFTDLFHVLDQIQTGGPGLAGDFNLDGVVDMNDVKGVIDHLGQPDPRAQEVKPTDGGDASTGIFRPGGDDTPGGNPTVFARIVPGDGFTADTPQPNPVGEPGMTGYDAKAIARWDVVPYQTFTGEFHVGVVAFHMNGIDRVEFAANGGPWVAVHEMQLNPRTNVWEYTAVLNAADFEDGPVEVRAVAYPKNAGEARVLAGSNLQVNSGEHSIFLYADEPNRFAERQAWVDPVNGADANDGLSSATAKRTMYGGLVALNDAFGGVDGGTVFLMAGMHDWESRSGSAIRPTHAMVAFIAAPGLGPDEVVIGDDLNISGYALRAYLVRIRGAEIRMSISDTTATSHPAMLWVDQCRFVGNGMTESARTPNVSQWQLGVYMTDAAVRNARVAFNGSYRLVRRGEAVDIGEDGFKNVLCIINSSVTRMTFADPSYHPDVVQYLGPQDNTIVYGLIAKDVRAQTIFTRGNDRHDNAAFVNMLFERTGAGSLFGQWIRESNHVLMSHITHVGTQFHFRDVDPTGLARPVQNLVIRNSVFDRVVYPTTNLYPAPARVFYNNHFIMGSQYGSSSTAGGTYSVIFSNTDRYHPVAGSVLDGRVALPDVPVDLFGIGMPPLAAVGSSQPE